MVQLEPSEYFIVSDEMVGENKWYGGDSYLPVITPTNSDAIAGEVYGAKCVGNPHT